MGLTAKSTGLGAVDQGLLIQKQTPADRVIALAGNPNVGKSTVFNALTHMRQHTGNWPGKTVSSAQGVHTFHQTNYILVDIPGTYSLMAHSQEEEVARDFLCFGGADAAIVVCDATCLERNLNLVLQTLEITPNVVVCVNLMDEAAKKGIRIDFESLERQLGVKVVATSARQKQGLTSLMQQVEALFGQSGPPNACQVRYLPAIEEALAMLIPVLTPYVQNRLPARWVALRLLDKDESLCAALGRFLGLDLLKEPPVAAALEQAHAHLQNAGIAQQTLRDKIIACIVLCAEGICADSVFFSNPQHQARDRKLDKWLTSRKTGIPIMLLLLLGVLWLTIAGANYPSALLWQGLYWIEGHLTNLFAFLGAPGWLHGALVLGVWRTLAWVVSVMLPPMAIFFPLFTLLEDFGYLPRVAFNLDNRFRKCGACGKQALTMTMGFGCNAAGVTGCRIIDSPRERLIAILTNNFVPCNGRFPPPT